MTTSSVIKMTEGVWFVYLLLCARGAIYTGVTPRVAQRMRLHRDGKGAKFTRMNKPLRLLAAKPYSDKRTAMQVEAQVKRMPADGKRFLAQEWSKQYPIDEAAQELLAVE